MNLYCKLPFGQLRHGNAEVIRLAEALDRTPSSVSMKLCNLASFDPSLQARGVGGLKAASKLDRQVWDEFHADWTAGLESSEVLFERIVKSSQEDLLGVDHRDEREAGVVIETPATDFRTEVTARRGEQLFRRMVLSSYNARCCITGIPVPALLRASYISPWREDRANRLNPHNGLCLAATQHAAFDAHLITIDEDLRLLLSRSLRNHCTQESLSENFLRFEGKRIALPERFTPESGLLERHRELLGG